MKAMTRDTYRSAHVLALSDIDVPTVTSDEVPRTRTLSAAIAVNS